MDSKKKLYILHGWAYRTDKWQPFLSALEKCGFEPVMIPIPGLTTPMQKPWTIDDFISYLEKTFPKNAPFFLLGHSNGGRLAIRFAIKHPGRIRHLILVDSAGVYHTDIHIQLKRSVFKLLSVIGQPLKNIPVFRKFVVFVHR